MADTMAGSRARAAGPVRRHAYVRRVRAHSHGGVAIMSRAGSTGSWAAGATRT
eukprot:SAG31_NODE_14517_length_802_cov_1.108108_1_plen_52_part_01